MTFEHPWILVLLVFAALPVVCAVCRRVHVRLPDAQRLAKPTLRTGLLWTLPALETLTIALLVVVAAGPQTGSRATCDLRNARDIIIALDTSESMGAMDADMRGRSRLGAAMLLTADFIGRRKGDRIGLVAFGGRAVTQCPLTFDRGLALWLLGQMEPNMLGRRTALGEAIALGAERLRERGGALVVISDGRNTAGEIAPLDASRTAQARNVRIYTIAVGSGGVAPAPVQLPSGRTVTREKSYPLDEATLRQAAEVTGGRSFRAADADALKRVLGKIDTLEPRPTDELRRLPTGQAAISLALLGAALSAALLLVSSVFLRTAPALR